jgi:hypothetical protein
LGVYEPSPYRDKKVVGVFVARFTCAASPIKEKTGFGHWLWHWDTYKLAQNVRFNA